MSVTVGMGAFGPGATSMSGEGTFRAGEHKNKTFDTPNGGKISVEGKSILSYSGPNEWDCAVGKGITINGKHKYEGKDGKLYLNGVLQE